MSKLLYIIPFDYRMAICRQRHGNPRQSYVLMCQSQEDKKSNVHIPYRAEGNSYEMTRCLVKSTNKWKLLNLYFKLY